MLMIAVCLYKSLYLNRFGSKGIENINLKLSILDYIHNYKLKSNDDFNKESLKLEPKGCKFSDIKKRGKNLNQKECILS